MIRVFLGYDSREVTMTSVCAHSIQQRASRPVSISYLKLAQLQNVFTREWHPLQTTEFSFSRFLVPYLSNFEGWSVFMDGDMLVLDDIARLWDLRDEHCAVQVVKHNHVPKESTKWLDAPQTKYEKKNWSSVMLFNNAKCTALTPQYVNSATGLQLHQFKWLGDDDLIGALPRRWNHLVGYDAPSDDVSLVHYTSGGPCFNAYRGCEYASEWYNEQRAMLHYAEKDPAQRKLINQ
jgi:hypothetical protein